MTGDVEREDEAGLIHAAAPLTADIVKVPHHGSKTSSTADFIAAVAPKVAVVSDGEANPFGHPAPGTVERYAEAGVRLLRTDRDGAVTSITDGRSMNVTTFAELHPR